MTFSADGLVASIFCLIVIPSKGYDEPENILSQLAKFCLIGADAGHAGTEQETSVAKDAQSSFGGLMNYTMFASTGGDNIDDMWSYEGVAGWFEGRVFSPLGVVTNSFIARTSDKDIYESTRLDTTWAYSNPQTLTSYRIGDVITGGLSWTRPTRLGGIQIQRNFGLRPDLVTMPLPDVSGSAAVPSTVDVYVNNTRRLSQQIPEGPFQITNLPVVTGSGTARIVVHDALGRETVSETPFYASPELLRSGLWDFSAEAGFARRFYGVESDSYDDRFMSSGTMRYGLTDRLTLEGHAEGGQDLINGGAGVVLGLGSYGVGSFAGAASTSQGETGFQGAASVELALWDLNFYGRSQRTFGDYNDIASVTAEPGLSGGPDISWQSASPPKALDQVSVSIPLNFDPATLNFSYTNLETVDNDRSQIIAASFNRPIFKNGTLFATAYKDIEQTDSFGLFVGLSLPLGESVYASTGVSSDTDGTSITTDLAKSETGEIGSYGWRLRDTEGAHTNRSAYGSYRSSLARFEAGVEQIDDQFRATAQMDGAVTVAGSDIFLSNRIDDAFAVVDAGAPGVEVQYENRPAGITNRNGKLLVPALRSYEPNQLSIDPANLPVDAVVGSTRETAIPADRSGTVVKFNVDKEARAALVTLRDEQGDFLETGANGHGEGNSNNFVIGYDGQAYIAGLGPQNRITIAQPTRGECIAEFAYRPHKGEQVTIPDVVCHPVE